MNKVFGLELQTFQELYLKHKNYIVPVLIIVVCFILLSQVTIPQVDFLSQKLQEENVERAKLNTLNKNLEILSSLNDSTLDSQLQLATDALPIEKNFAGIVNTVNLSANKAGVFLGDYEFTVGDLSKVGPGKNAPSLELVLAVNGGAAPTGKFVSELYKSLPVAEVTSIVVTGNRSTVTAIFYYKPFVGQSDTTSPLPSLTQDKVSLIRELSAWNNPRILEQINFVATSSATSSSPF